MPGSPKPRLWCGGGAGCRPPGLRLLSSAPPVARRPDPSAACSRLKRLFCGGAVLDATRTPPSNARPRPRPRPGPTRRTQPPRRPTALHGLTAPTTTAPRKRAPAESRHPSDTLRPTQTQSHTHTPSRRHSPHRRSPTTPYKQSHTNNPTQAPHHLVPPSPRNNIHKLAADPQTP